MKNFKKIASAIAALSLAACMVAPVATMTSFAEETKGSITITNPTGVKHTYEAYQIFSGKLDESGKILTDIKWANGVSASALVDALQSESLKIEYKTPAAEGVEETVVSNANPFKDVPDYDADNDKSAKAVADILSTLTPNGVKQFLTVVATNLASSPTSSVDAQISQGEKYGDVTINNLDPGYYFIKDKDSSLAEQDDAYTRYMVQVLGTVSTIAPKSEKPSVDKQVLDNDSDDATTDPTKGNATESDLAFTGGTWCETADHAIGEQFQFKLTAKMPKSAELDAYKAYTLKFTDKMATGVTYEGIVSVTVHFTDGTTANVPAKADGTSGYDLNLTSLTEDGENYKGNGTATWTLSINDLTKFLTNTTGDPKAPHKLSEIEKVEVIYNAHLNEEAVVTNVNVTDVATDGKYFGDNTKVNANDVFLEYSNNPNKGDWNFEGTGDSDTGKTTPDTVGVFTYEVDSTKYADKVEAGKELAGAKFRLSKTDGGKTYYAKFTKGTDGYTYTFTGNWVESTAESLDGTEIESYADSTPEKTNAGKFNIKGLDAGTYQLVETAAPSGYNILNDPVDITIYAEHAEDAAGGGATLNFSKDTTKSKYDKSDLDGTTALGGSIINQKGASLPSTGGIGTTLFYLGGGALVAVAGVMLITKKRMTKE